DEIGELAVAFNRMGKQLNFHINALRQEKEQLTSIVNSMADGVVTLTREGKIIVINPPAEQFMQDWHFENNILFDEHDRQLPDDLDRKSVVRRRGKGWTVMRTMNGKTMNKRSI